MTNDNKVVPYTSADLFEHLETQLSKAWVHLLSAASVHSSEELDLDLSPYRDRISAMMQLGHDLMWRLDRNLPGATDRGLNLLSTAELVNRVLHPRSDV